MRLLFKIVFGIFRSIGKLDPVQENFSYVN